MNTQTTEPGDNQGTNSSDDVLGAGAKSSLPTSSSMKMPSLPKSGGVEPPADLPFVDDVDAAKSDVLESSKVVSNVFKPTPKIVPGVRGPLPSAPTNMMKSSSAKFGIGTSLKGSTVNKEMKKTAEASAPASIVQKSDKFDKDNTDDVPAEEIIIKKEDEQRSESDVRVALSSTRSKLGVPRPPVAPESEVGKEIEELLNDSSKGDSAKIDGKSIPPPTAPPAGSVDRNIRPRRLAIVIIVLLLFIAAIFMSLWYFLTRGTGTTTKPQSTDSSLFSPEPTPDAGIVTPMPSSDVVSVSDSDSDGLLDAQEVQLGTDQFKADTDGDGYTDKQELDAGYDPLVDGGKLDSDRDGLADPDEKCWGTDAHNPDTEGDGYLDGQEVVNGYDPLIASPNDKLTGASRCKL